MKPYLMTQNQYAHEKGLPPMRPLFFDFPKDEQVHQIDDQFMLGPDLLVAPILEEGKEKRKVYLPSGVNWKDAWSGTTSYGGQVIEADAPLEKIPVFWRDGSHYYFQF